MGPCMCGDPYCGSCGPAQGYHKCRHGNIQGDCETKDCYNNPNTPTEVAQATMDREMAEEAAAEREQNLLDRISEKD